MGKPKILGLRDRHEVGATPEADAHALHTTDVALPTFDESALPEFAQGDDPTTTPMVDSIAIGDVHRAPYLVFLTGAREGELVRLDPGESVVLGRSKSCELFVDDEGISRRHARVTHVASELVELEDLDSRNGTFVGDERIRKRRLGLDEIMRLGARTVIKLCFMDELEAEAHRRLLDAALRDALTGVYNRRQFHDRLAIETAAARRYGRPMSLLLFDIDNFKLINDRHGHPAGDAVLRAVAESLRIGARREDDVFRYGGEEFAILARETDLAGGMRLAERRLVDVRALRFPDLRAITSVTVSAGVAAFDPKEASEQLVQRADAALYAAKRAGKDRAVPAT